MPRAIWKASIQFGPVSVPVKLYPAVKDVRRHSHLLHDREHPVVLWARGQLLVVMMLHFHEEMVDRDEIKPKQAKLQPAKVKAITAAMDDLKGKYDPAGYMDEQQRHILDFLRDKAEQQGTVLAAAPQEEQEQPAGEEGQDLVSALEESLARTRAK